MEITQNFIVNAFDFISQLKSELNFIMNYLFNIFTKYLYLFWIKPISIHHNISWNLWTRFKVVYN